MPATHLALRAEQRILFLRGQRVMLDFHLAELYAVESRREDKSSGMPVEVNAAAVRWSNVQLPGEW